MNTSVLSDSLCFLPLPQDDPFWTVQTLTPHEKQLIQNQSVCSLEQLLKLASFNNCTVVFRLRRPPPEHPCHHSWINITLQTVLKSGIQQSLVRGQGMLKSDHLFCLHAFMFGNSCSKTGYCYFCFALEVFWTPDEQRAQVKEMAPGLVHSSLVKPESPKTLQQEGISGLLLRYNQTNSQEIR